MFITEIVEIRLLFDMTTSLDNCELYNEDQLMNIISSVRQPLISKALEEINLAIQPSLRINQFVDIIGVRYNIFHYSTLTQLYVSVRGIWVYINKG